MSAEHPHSIPYDEHQQALSDKDRIIEEKDHVIDERDRRIALLEEIVRLQKLARFAAKTEKYTAEQRELFNEAELAVEGEALLSELETQQEEDLSNRNADQCHEPKARGRKPLPAELPRVRIEHELPESERQCKCGCQLIEIGEETSEQLDIIPAKIQILVNVRKKYACNQCEQGVKTAEAPAQAIPKSNASAGLLAHIACSKYQDALPLYRQEVVLARHGIEIPRNTLANWMIKSGELIQPLINLMEDQLFSHPILHCDETSVQVLKEDGKKAQSKSYMWVRAGGPESQPIRLFHYAPSRSGEVASALLAGFKGYVQTDDYAGYNSACDHDDITQLGCWAHARRKFVEAQKANSGKNKKAGKADVAISLIQKLYSVEKFGADLSPESRLALRQEKSKPILEKIRAWLDRALGGALPKGLLGKALAYLDKNWKKLTVYTEDGRLKIDNNTAENAIRPFVVGRKNWLFSNSVQGAKSSANLYSLIETAKASGLEPYAYLKHVFTKLPQANSVAEIEALLPWAADC